jgi:hypothetical protein
LFSTFFLLFKKQKERYSHVLVLLILLPGAKLPEDSDEFGSPIIFMGKSDQSREFLDDDQNNNAAAQDLIDRLRNPSPVSKRTKATSSDQPPFPRLHENPPLLNSQSQSQPAFDPSVFTIRFEDSADVFEVDPKHFTHSPTIQKTIGDGNNGHLVKNGSVITKAILEKTFRMLDNPESVSEIPYNELHACLKVVTFFALKELNSTIIGAIVAPVRGINAVELRGYLKLK